jgi:orotidine-5'-phosphate decarboxylase
MSAILRKYEERVEAVNSLLCVGLDSELSLLPERFQAETFPQFAFNQWMIDQTAEFASSVKPNMAFYEARGVQGLTELEMTMEYLRATYPELVTICDAKRADIGNTNKGYVEAVFDRMGFDAITLHPYLGREALRPFLEREDKASIVLCRTSNPGAGELQNLVVDGKPMWQIVAEKVSGEWSDVSGRDAEDSRGCAGCDVPGAGDWGAGWGCCGGGCGGSGCEWSGHDDFEFAGDFVQR